MPQTQPETLGRDKKVLKAYKFARSSAQSGLSRGYARASWRVSEPPNSVAERRNGTSRDVFGVLRVRALVLRSYVRRRLRRWTQTAANCGASSSPHRLRVGS